MHHNSTEPPNSTALSKEAVVYTHYYVVDILNNLHIPLVSKIHQIALVEAYYKLGRTEVDTYEVEDDCDCPF